MLHLTHSGGVLRLNPKVVTRLAPVYRRAKTVSFSSGENMNNKNKGGEQPNDPTKTHHGWRDGMSHSFGEGYSTRSDEEGFGGIYGGNQDSDITHPEYDESQGSEVKEKEKARHQAHVA